MAIFSNIKLWFNYELSSLQSPVGSLWKSQSKHLRILSIKAVVAGIYHPTNQIDARWPDHSSNGYTRERILLPWRCLQTSHCKEVDVGLSVVVAIPGFTSPRHQKEWWYLRCRWQTVEMDWWLSETLTLLYSTSLLLGISDFRPYVELMVYHLSEPNYLGRLTSKNADAPGYFLRNYVLSRSYVSVKAM